MSTKSTVVSGNDLMELPKRRVESWSGQSSKRIVTREVSVRSACGAAVQAASRGSVQMKRRSGFMAGRWVCANVIKKNGEGGGSTFFLKKN